MATLLARKETGGGKEGKGLGLTLGSNNVLATNIGKHNKFPGIKERNGGREGTVAITGSKEGIRV